MTAVTARTRPDPAAPGDALVEDVLAEYGDLTRRTLQSYLPTGETRPYLYALMADYPRRRGKMLRSSLCVATARMLGAPAADALPSAASIELLHNALLVHDDIEDGSDERRGAPTLHALHGVPLALNAGDALGLLSLTPLKENIGRLGRSLASRILDETERTAWETAEGQALELGWRRDNDAGLRDEDYFRMVLQKTCWLTTIHPLRVGCLIGARGARPLDPLIRVGFFFGAAFQIQDDLLNLEAGPAYGKERDGDLLEGKRTLMIIHALQQATAADAKRLQRFLRRERRRRGPAETAWVKALFERTGAIVHARRVATAFAGAALCEFDAYFDDVADGRERRFVRELLTWVVRRQA